jgi:hypothetical protein
MKLNKLILFTLVGLVIVGVCVSRVKYEVVSLRKKLVKVNAEMEQSTDDLNVFRAEWGYLNQPEKLKELCNKHLKSMIPVENCRIVSYQEIVNGELEENKINEDSVNPKQSNPLGSFLDEMLDKKSNTRRR